MGASDAYLQATGAGRPLVGIGAGRLLVTFGAGRLLVTFGAGCYFGQPAAARS